MDIRGAYTVCAGQTSFLLFFLLSLMITFLHRHYDEPTSLIDYTHSIHHHQSIMHDFIPLYLLFLLYISCDSQELSPQPCLYKPRTSSTLKCIGFGLYFSSSQPTSIVVKPAPLQPSRYWLYCHCLFDYLLSLLYLYSLLLHLQSIYYFSTRVLGY